MAKTLAIEWDAHELRMVVAHHRGAGVVIDQALIFPLGSDSEESSLSTDARVAKVLTEQVASHGFTKIPAIIGIQRSGIELQVISVPPVPDDELPDLVRFQALREFSSIAEDGVVDFIKLPPADDGRARVHAAAISGKQLKTYRTLCEKAQLQPQRFSLRSFGAAHLAVSQSQLADSTFLLVDPLLDRVELSVVHQGNVILTRTTRLPGEVNSDHYQQALQGEIRRTILAARTKEASAQITQIVLFGEPASPAIWRQFGDDLKVEVDFLNPLQAEHVSSSIDMSPELSSRLGAMIGLLLLGTAHPGVDFLNPRRKPDPPDRRRVFVLGGLAAASLIFGVGYLLWSALAAQDNQIAALQQEIAKLQKTNQALVEMEEDIIEIDQWVAADIQWLDELYRMADVLPSADEMIATRIQMQTASVGGTLSLEGYVSDPSVISKIESSIRDQRRQVLGRESKNNEYGDSYHWSFSELITIAPDELDRFASRPPAVVEGDTDPEPPATEEEPAVVPQDTETVSTPGEPEVASHSREQS